MHALLNFHHIHWLGDKPGEFHGLGPVTVTSEFVSSPTETVPIAFNEGGVARHDVGRALLHIASNGDP